jgi:hypothetical protein
MQMPNQLVQIIPEPYQLTVDEFFVIILRLMLHGAPIPLKEQRASEMRGPHAERGRALPDARQLACGET